ncbi:MAG: hypothetical protein ACE5G0_19405 [Rhodothermales bacterium]
MPYVVKSSLLRLSILFSSLLPVVALIGCGPAPEDQTEVTIAEAFAFESLGWGQRATLDTTEIAIRDTETWGTYQAALRPLMPFEEVDFMQEMVLLAAVPVPSGGYSVRFELVEKANDTLTVHYVLSEPAYDCLTTVGDAVVFQAVRLAQTDGAIRFERSYESYRCTERKPF